MIYSYNNWGYEGSIVTVETDLRKGIPSVDIVGLADGAVKGSRERMRSAIQNSGFNLPQERVLIGLSPADLKKEGSGFDLPMALSMLSAKDDYPRSQDAKVLVMGELELSGSVLPVRAVTAALQSAKAIGVKYAILPKLSEKFVTPIHVEYVETLREAYDALCRIDEAEALGNEFEPESIEQTDEISFPDIDGESLDNIDGHNELKYAMAVAAAGRHNMLVWGRPGGGKSVCLQRMPEITPNLTEDEAKSVARIHSIAGLLNISSSAIKYRPFRQPHQTASIEGMCGGGVHVRPGEISLAHNGTLFLDEAAEFRSLVLQMLRVPMEQHTITLSRAGRTTVFPANFQLIMATQPCPCGNYGSKDKVCLCSARSVEQYWKKFSAPLLDRVEIRFNVDKDEDSGTLPVKELREAVKRAVETQMKRQHKFNRDLNEREIADYCKLDDKASKLFNEWAPEKSDRCVRSVLKVARTISDMNGDDLIIKSALELAIKLRGITPDETLYQ